MSDSNLVQVAVRVRPLNKSEIRERNRLCINDISTNSLSIDSKDVKTFSYDYVAHGRSTKANI